MKLLILMARYPFPPQTGGARVAYNNIKELAKRHWVHLVCVEPASERGDIPTIVAELDLLPLKRRPRFVRMIRSTFYLLMGLPPSISVHKRRDLRERVKTILDQQPFDAVLLYEMSAVQFCPPSAYGKAIINVEDPQSLRLHRMLMLDVWPAWKRLELLLYAKLTARYERRFLPPLRRVLLLSSADMRDMRDDGGYDNLGTVSYGIGAGPASRPLPMSMRTAGMIVFSGNMYHAPNVDGALFLLRDVFPQVLESCPSAALWIVGSDPDARLKRAAERYGDRVVITGRVDDISAYVGRAMVSVCPVKLQVGVQTKILEALEAATPVVTTSAGNSGVRGRSGAHLWVADDPEEFANRVIELLNGERWDSLSASGRQFALEHFSWEKSARELEGYLQP